MCIRDRLWGGQGQFGAAVVAVAWLQAIFVLLQALQLVALYVLPPLAGLIGLVSILLFFWLLTHFVTEVHGFATPVLVLIGIILTGFAVSFVLAFAMISILGPEAFVDV